ncbi:MAG: hypothetical protein AVDCRST_MAG73-3850, partial [uncultured Thermomicrobiales bacterium]
EHARSFGGSRALLRRLRRAVRLHRGRASVLPGTGAARTDAVRPVPGHPSCRAQRAGDRGPGRPPGGGRTGRDRHRPWHLWRGERHWGSPFQPRYRKRLRRPAPTLPGHLRLLRRGHRGPVSAPGRASDLLPGVFWPLAPPV